MGGASIKHIKNRIKSVESTRQITKAMELVATSKLRRAKERAERTRPYHDVLAEAIAGLQAGVLETPCVFAEQREVKKTCYVVIGGDRGLAGGYNANLFRLAAQKMQTGESCVLPIGKKTLEHFTRTGCELVSTYFGVTAALGVGDCAQIANLLCDGYATGKFDCVEILYTRFQSMLTLLEGNPAALVEKIVPLYLTGVLYATLCEAAASEHGARRTAMNAANKNAGELIDDLVLHYNRARQAAITQEITEIVSGAEAL